jgi:ribonuclease VapC
VIVLDTSALMALLLAEPTADRIAGILEAEDRLVISAGTLAEALVVAGRRGVFDEMRALLDGIGVEVESLTSAVAHKVARAHQDWGKGRHPAGLNFGDCFAYVTAKQLGSPLLFVGDDFLKTDVVSVL